MAHAKDTQRRVRAAYVADCLELPAAAAASGVPLATARRWKMDAKKAGDDWDKARGAHLLAGGSIEDVLRQTMAGMIRQVTATIQGVEADPDMPAVTKTQLLASCADSTAKLTAAMKRMMPETDELAVRMDTVKKLAEFVKTHYPQHVQAFMELLQPFGQELARG